MFTDFAKLVVAILAVLLIAGVLPFTATWVGIIFLATTFEFKVTWR